MTADGSKVRRQADAWHIRYKDASGKWQSTRGYTDEQATWEKVKALEATGKAFDKVKAARLAEGLERPWEDQQSRPLVEHLADFQASLAARNNSPEHVSKVIACIRIICEQCGFATLADVDAGKVERWLADAQRRSPAAKSGPSVTGTARTYREIGRAFGVTEEAVKHWRKAGTPIQAKAENRLEAIARWRESRQLDKGGHSAQTRNHHLRSIKQFTRWLVKRGRSGNDPLIELSPVEVRSDRRHDRRALDPAEFGRLLDAAARGPVVEGLAGPDRVMLYLLAGWTGFRRKELASLTSRSFDLEGIPPAVKILACYSKNKRSDAIPLHPVVVERLQEWFASKPHMGADDRLFALRTDGGSWRKTNKMMAVDLAAAGLSYQDEAGLYADFHSNRHTFISNLGRAGVSVTMAQKLARHSTPSLTANVYTHLGLEDKAGAIASLPSPEMPEAAA